ncbi:hypothetical protein Tco_0463537, partial [Tanacetum coccineum]
GYRGGGGENPIFGLMIGGGGAFFRVLSSLRVPENSTSLVKLKINNSRVLREEDVRGVESDLVDSFEEGEIRCNTPKNQDNAAEW